MPENLTIGARMTLDAKQMRQELNQISREMSAVMREFSHATVNLEHWNDSIEGASLMQKRLTEQLALQERRVQTFQAYCKHLEDQMEGNTKVTAKMRRELERATKDQEDAVYVYQRYQRQLEKAEKEMERLRREEREQNSEVGKLTRKYREQDDELERLVMEYQDAYVKFGAMSDETLKAKNRMDDMNKELAQTRLELGKLNDLDVRQPLSDDMSLMNILGYAGWAEIAIDGIRTLFRGLGDGIQKSMDEFVEYQSAFAGVRRTVEGSAEDFRRLNIEIQTLGKQLATPVAEIADIATIAGQMGIGVDEISEFTRVMIQLGDTTNVSAEEAGASLAQLSNLLGLTTDEYERMGSAIVQLGNEYPTTEQDIIDMSARLAGMAGQVSMSAADVLGLANALAAVGLEAEMGGNTVSKTLREMLMAVENNTEALALFASTADMSIDEFSRAFRENATQALSAFVEGLDDVERNGKSATQILRELGITETRQIDTLLRLAGNSTLLAESVASANASWEENVALAREAARRYETIESRTEMMNNAWRNVGISIGEFLQPFMEVGIDLSTRLAEALNGTEDAAYQLESKLTNLTGALADYKDAQDDAASSTNNLTRYMLDQATARSVFYSIDFAKTLDNAFGNIEDAEKNIKGLPDEIAHAEEQLMNYIQWGSEYAAHGITDIDSYLEWFIRAKNTNYHELDRDEQMMLEGSRSYGQLLLDSGVLEQTYKNVISDNRERIADAAVGLADLLEKFPEADLASSELFNNMSSGAQEMVNNIINNLDETDERAKEEVDSILARANGSKEEIIKAWEDYEHSMDSILNADDFDSYWYAFTANAKKYLEPAYKEAKRAQKAQEDAFISNTDNIRRMSEIMEQFRGNLAETETYNLAMGITGEDAAKSEMSDYQKAIRDLISTRLAHAAKIGLPNITKEVAKELMTEFDTAENVNEFMDKMGLSGIMSADAFRAYLQEILEGFNELATVTEEYQEKYGEYIPKEMGKLEEIMAKYRADSEKTLLTSHLLGDSYDYAAEKVNVINAAISSLLAMDPSEWSEEWQTALGELMALLGEYDTSSNKDYDSLASKFYAIQRGVEGLSSITDEGIRNNMAKTLGSNAHTLLKQLLEQDTTGWSKSMLDDLEKAKQVLQDIINMLGTEDTGDSLNWWERFKSDRNSQRLASWGISDPEEVDKYYDTVAGIQSLFDDIGSFWNEFGKGILDNINGWFDLELQAIDALSKELEEELEAYQKMMEAGEQIRENELRKQLQSGEISEEEYYRQSAKNKLDSEAEKQRAEEETQRRQEQLDAKREAIERKQFEANKANSIAEAVISMAQGIAAAWTNPWTAPYITALIAGIGASQIGLIAAQKYTPALAKGGIVNGPTTALIGEDGPEAVIPLVNNTEWITELAERLNAIMSSDLAVDTVRKHTVQDSVRTERIAENQSFTQIINSPKALSRREIYRDTRRLFSMVRRANEQ